MPPTKNGDFNRGICAVDGCENSMFRLAAKYAIGKIVKAADGHGLVWQWYCNACGAVHQEPCNVVTHEI